MRRAAMAALVALAGEALATSATPPPGLGEALAAQRALVEAQPTDVGARNDLGNLLVLASDPEAAAAAYEEALRLDSDAILPRYNLALLELERGHLRVARRHLERVLAVDRGHALARYRLGDIAAAREHHSRAVRHYEHAFRLEPGLADPARHPEVLFNRLADWASRRAYLAPTLGLRARRYAEASRLAGVMMGAPPPEPAVPAEPVTPPEQ